MKLITLVNGFRPTARITSELLAGISMMALATSASAQTSFWSNATLNNVDTPHSWSTASNWTGNAVPSFGVGSTINFTTADIFTGTHTAIGANRTVGTLNFSDPTAGNGRWYLMSDGNSLQMEVSSGVPVIDVSSNILAADIANNITGNQGLRKTGGSTLNLHTTNKTYTGTTYVDSGTLNLTSVNMSSDSVVLGSSALFRITGVTQTLTNIGGNGTIALSQSTLIIDNSSNITFNGTISKGTYTGNLQKTGAGVLVLTKYNSHGGSTSVSGGTLVIAQNAGIDKGVTVSNNSTLVNNGTVGIAASSIGAGSTLSGSGTFESNVTISGIHSPGNSPGIQTFERNLTYNAGSSINWELIANTTDGRGVNYDGIDVGTDGLSAANDLRFNGATTLNLNFAIGGSLVDWTNEFWSQNRAGVDGWKIFDVNDQTYNFENLTLASGPYLDSEGRSFKSVRGSGIFELQKVGNDVYLAYFVPEPSSLILASLGALCLFRRKRA